MICACAKKGGFSARLDGCEVGEIAVRALGSNDSFKYLAKVPKGSLGEKGTFDGG